jgi:hypothetical protein
VGDDKFEVGMARVRVHAHGEGGWVCRVRNWAPCARSRCRARRFGGRGFREVLESGVL